jgi:hypothetical protein
MRKPRFVCQRRLVATARTTIPLAHALASKLRNASESDAPGQRPVQVVPTLCNALGRPYAATA